jgi:hypothetical protein
MCDGIHKEADPRGRSSLMLHSLNAGTGGGVSVLCSSLQQNMMIFSIKLCNSVCVLHSNNLLFLHIRKMYNTIKVARLYRKSLKMLSSWVIDREIFLEEATALRARFDAERGVSNAKAIRLLKVSFRVFNFWEKMAAMLHFGVLEAWCD